MAPSKNPGGICSATYSNVPVYEFNVNGNHVMRRRVDDWINATHILKVADFDKPARTRILEREVQKGVHEKVQGGYGKYQGTWVPLREGRDLAERNGVLQYLLPIFDFVPGDQSPPQAPKHTTAASSKPKAPRLSAAAKRAQGWSTREAKSMLNPNSDRHEAAPSQSLMNDDQYSNISAQLNDDDTPDNSSMISGDFNDDFLHYSQQSGGGSQKRKRPLHDDSGRLTIADQQHQTYSDELLDYFMLSGQHGSELPLPVPPPSFRVDRPIDDYGHAALHWAAAMGDVDVVKDLVNRGANVSVRNHKGETPLMRAVAFTNNYEKATMPKVVNILQQTIQVTDSFHMTVFHHLNLTTASKHKGVCARYYQEAIINKLSETMGTDEIRQALDAQDVNGDTALHIAARNGSKKCCRSLQGHFASSDIPNKNGELAGHMLAEIFARNINGKDPHAGLSSSPFLAPLSPSLNAVSKLPALQDLTAASTMVQTILPLIHEKSQKLADAISAEKAEKEEQHDEALRLLKNVQTQHEETRRAIYDLASTADDTLLARKQHEELAALEKENELLLEQSQYRALRLAIAEQEANLVVPPTPQLLNAESLREKLSAALELAAAQEERKRLVREVVQAAAVTGTNEKSGEYRKLIAMTLRQPEDQLNETLPEILRALEEMNEEGMSEGLVGVV